MNKEEAIKIVKSHYPANKQMLNEALEFLIPELKEDENEKIRKEIIAVFKGQIAFTSEEDAKKYIAWLEKQGEQKPADKVEPKFHEGKWITNGDYTWKIVEVKPLDYILQSQDGNIVDDTISHVDEQFHSFIIQDAKDGDILACGDKVTDCPFIFHDLTEDSNPRSYCGINTLGQFQVNDEDGGFWCPADGVRPVTKEQRNLLFQKMKESGYTWDSKKKELKELKKIEQKWWRTDYDRQL